MQGMQDEASSSNSTTVASRAFQSGVEVQSVSSRTVDVPVQPGITLGYGAIPTNKIPVAVRLLRECFDE
jgi:hypothetical protein